MKKISEFLEEGKEAAKSGVETVNNMISSKIDAVNLRLQYSKNEKRIKELYSDVGKILTDSYINEENTVAENGIIKIDDFSVFRISGKIEEIKRITKENEDISFCIDLISKKNQISEEEEIEPKEDNKAEDNKNEVIYCTNCGKEADVEDAFCRRCGTKLKK